MFVQIGSVVVGDTTKSFVGDGGFVSDAKIWRYMELWKFRDLLLNGLFFARLPMFPDKFEGTSPAMLPKMIEQAIRDQGGDIDSHLRASEEWHATVTMRSLATCWNERPTESDLFWRNYAGAPHGDGVAIVTTQGRLQRAVPESVLVSRVRYIDYEIASEYSANPRIRAIAKSVEFEDERECRGIIHDFPRDGESYWDPIPPDLTHGYHVKTNLQTLIDEVIISPYSPTIIDSVSDDLKRAGLAVAPSQSTLNRRRYF